LRKDRKKRTIFGYFVMAYLLVVILFTLYRYYDESRNLDNIIKSKLQNGAAMVKYVMPRDYFDKAVNQYSISESNYSGYTEFLSHAAWENRFSYLYAFKEEDGKFHYIAASMNKKDLGSNKNKHYWYEYQNAPSALIKAFKTHKATYAKTKDSSGTFYTIYYPEYSPSGQFYISCADYDFLDIKMSLNSILYSAALQALTLLLLLLLIYITLSRLQKHYIRKLQYSNIVNEASPIGVISIQPDGQIDYVNPVFANLIGLPIESLEGHNIQEDLGFYVNDELINRIRICLLRQISWQGEFLNVSLSGAEYWVNAIINYTKAEDEGRAMLNVFASNVTIQMKSRISLGQHNKVLNYLSQAIHSLLAYPDVTKTLYEVISKYGENLGKSKVSILKFTNNNYDIVSSWVDIDEADNSIPINMFSQINKPLYTDWDDNLKSGKCVGGESYDFPISLITLARIQNPGILNICPIFSADKYWGFIISLQTQRDEIIDEELEQTVMYSIADSIGSALKRSEIDYALRQSNDAKTRFMSSMSHEIRTPLNGVIGMINLLESTELTDEQKDFIEAIKVSGRLLLNLINNILDISRIEAGKTQLRNDPVVLENCVQSAINVVNYELNEKKLLLDLSWDSKLPLVIQADETRLKQVIVNLLHNAIKFTDSGSIKITVARLSKKSIQFSITDTGVGMTSEQIAHIFEPFYQTGPISQRLKGTGLGLAITKQLIELMNGEITVRSEPGQGTAITFTIEVAILDDNVDYSTGIQETDKAADEQEMSSLKPTKIAVLLGKDLDDKILQNFLLSKRYKHLTAENLKELRDIIPADDIKIIFINLSHHCLKQKNFLVDLKKTYIDFPEKRWLIITDKTTGDLIDPEFSEGYVYCLPKPLDFKQLLLYLQNAIVKNKNGYHDAQDDMKLEEH